MPELNQIELFLDGSYSKDEKEGFIFKSRCLCSYLERALVKEAFATDYSRINIKCSKKGEMEEHARPLKRAPFLEVYIQYELPPIKSLCDDDLHGHFINIIVQGLGIAQTRMPIPLGFCVEIMREFEQNGYENSWIHSNKSWGRYSCRSLIEAKLTLDHFILHQSIYQSNELVSKKMIAETKPREMLFLPYLGRTKVVAGRYVLYEKSKHVISIFDLVEGCFISGVTNENDLKNSTRSRGAEGGSGSESPNP